MITIYLKQSYNLLKENRFVNGISIAGTALSVAAVMLTCLPSKFFCVCTRV